MRISDITLNDSIFLLDSNALMHDHFLTFIKSELVSAVKQFRAQSGSDYFIYIPKTVKEELESLRQRPNTDNIGNRTKAVRGYTIMEELVTKGYGKIVKSDFTGAAGGFNDVAMLTMLMELRRHSNVAVLTNDRNFCTDLLTLNHLKSVDSKRIVRCFYVNNKTGKMAEWKLDPEYREAVRFPNELSRGGRP